MPDDPSVIWHPSPNFGPRRNAARPSLIVLHYTAMESAQGALERLCDSRAEVSAHYLICEHGQTWQMVTEADRAWHAGAGCWHDITDVNSHSIGIEMANRGDHPFSELQMAALERLLSGIMVRWNIPSEGVIGHSDMAPGRKIDPGPRFDWTRLARQGLAAIGGHDTGPKDLDFALFRTAAQNAGYTAKVDDETLLAAVRLRYRPWAKGPLCPEDFTALGRTALWT